MGMKPRLPDSRPPVDPKTVSSREGKHPGDESNPNIANTVTTHKVIGNVPLVSNTVTKVKGGA